MLELNISQNRNTQSSAYGKYFARVEYKKTMSIDDMARHMAEHNTPFSVGTIAGILKDFVACTREQCLNGNTVKIDNLAIFKCSVQANGLVMGPNYKIVGGLGNVPNTNGRTPDYTKESQYAIKSAKLLAQATGEFTREELNSDATFRWTKAAKDAIEELTSESETGGNGGGSNGGSSQGSETGQGGDNSGSQGGNSGSQSGSSTGSETAEGYALSISTIGSGSASVTKDGNAVTSGSNLSEDDEVEISITPAEGETPTATINGSEIELTESEGVYSGSFAMPGQASSLVINTGGSSGGNGGADLDKD